MRRPHESPTQEADTSKTETGVYNTGERGGEGLGRDCHRASIERGSEVDALGVIVSFMAPCACQAVSAIMMRRRRHDPISSDRVGIREPFGEATGLGF